MRFSKPCCLRFENGRLSGSAHTRSCRVSPRAGIASASRPHPRSLRERKDIQHSSLRRVLRKILYCVAESKRNGGIARVESPCDYGSCPSSYSREDGDVLPSIRPFVGNRLPDNSRSGLKLPQDLSTMGIGSLEPSVHRAEKDHIARGCNGSAPYWE